MSSVVRLHSTNLLCVQYEGLLPGSDRLLALRNDILEILRASGPYWVYSFRTNHNLLWHAWNHCRFLKKETQIWNAFMWNGLGGRYVHTYIFLARRFLLDYKIRFVKDGMNQFPRNILKGSLFWWVINVWRVELRVRYIFTFRARPASAPKKSIRIEE